MKVKCIKDCPDDIIKKGEILEVKDNEISHKLYFGDKGLYKNEELICDLNSPMANKYFKILGGNMLFTDEDLLKALDLKLDDKVKMGYTYQVQKINKKIKLVSVGRSQLIVLDLKELINSKFEKIEQKIWTVDTISIGDIYYFIDYSSKGMDTWYTAFNKNQQDSKIFNSSIAFTKQEYVEEYLEELKKFNQEYKEKVQHD